MTEFDVMYLTGVIAGMVIFAVTLFTVNRMTGL